MVVVARASFPRRHLNQVVSAYTGLAPLPPGITKTGPFFQPGEEAVQALTFYNVTEGNPDKLLAVLRERYNCFAPIPGFACDIQEWREFRELLAGWLG